MLLNTLTLLHCLSIWSLLVPTPVEKHKPYSLSRDSVVLAFINDYWHKGKGYPADGYGWGSIGDDNLLRRGTIRNVPSNQKLHSILFLRDGKNNKFPYTLPSRFGKGVRDYIMAAPDSVSAPEEWTEVYTGTDGVRFMKSGFGDYPGWAYLISSVSRHKGKRVPQKIGTFKLYNGLGLGSAESEVCKAFGKPRLRKMYKDYTVLVYSNRLKAKGQTRDEMPFNMVTGSAFAFKSSKMVEMWKEFWDVYHP